jgi:hypothetical protein
MAAALVTTGRIPPPWSVEEYNDACFIVRDHNGQQLAPCRRSAAKLLMRVRRGGSRRISLAKLPELLPASGTA